MYHVLSGSSTVLVTMVITVHWTMTHCDNPRPYGSVLGPVSFLLDTRTHTSHSNTSDNATNTHNVTDTRLV